MKRFLSHIRWADVLTFMLFVVMAFAGWLGHALQSMRTTRVPVLIQYTGKPGYIGLGSEGLPDTVLIEVRDAGAQLNIYHHDPLHLTIDLRTYIHGDKGTIHIPSDVLRRSISDILQSTSQLIETKPEEISCTYFTEQEKTVCIAPDCALQPASEYQIVGTPTLSRNRVKLYGREKDLAEIDTLYTMHTDLSELSDTTDIRLALAIPQGMRAETDSVDMRIIAERYTEKLFTLPIRVAGVPEGAHLRLFPQQAEVRVRVGMAHFAKIQPSDVRVVCTYSPDRVDKLDVELKYSNPYITAAWVYPATVEFILEQ